MAKMPKMVLNIKLNVESLEIGPNSMLVARSDEQLSPKVADMLKNVLRGRLDDAGFKDVPVFVTDKGIDLSVMPKDAVDNLQALMDARASWADVVFAGQPISGVLAHLKKEVQELIDNPDDPHEFADCFGLLIGFWSRMGGTAESAILATYEKLEICKKRKYGEPDEDGSVQHIEESGDMNEA